MTAYTFFITKFPAKSVLFGCMLLPSLAFAVPEVVNHNPVVTSSAASATATLATSSVADTAISASSTAATLSPTNNPNQPTLAQMNKPTDSQLSQANIKLLTNNAELQRQVDSLSTQVNVLVNERSGQIFTYGAFTAFISLLTGLILGWILFGRKGRW